MRKLWKKILDEFCEWREHLQTWQEHKILRFLPQCLMGFTIVVITLFMFPSSQTLQFANLKENDVYTGEEVIAPFTFFINKTDDEISRDRQTAVENVPLVFNRNDSVEIRQLMAFDDFFKELNTIRTSEQADSMKADMLQTTLDNFGIIVDRENLRLILDNPNKPKTDGKKLQGEEQRISYETMRRSFRQILLDIYTTGILNRQIEKLPEYVSRIAIISTERETIENVDGFLDPVTFANAVLNNLKETFPEQISTTVKVGYQIITYFVEPNLIYDEAETNARIDEAVNNVPLSKGIVLENERILSPHERVTSESLDKLRSLASAKAERELKAGGLKLILPYIAKVLLIGLALSFAMLFLLVARKEIFFNLKKMLMIFVLFLMIITISFFIKQTDFASNPEYLIPISIASMLLTIFFDTRVAFIGTVTLSIIVGALFSNDFGITVTCLFVGTISTFAVREIQARSWMIRGMLFIASAYVVAISAIELLQSSEFDELSLYWLFGLINGVLSPILAYGLMIIFEYVFGFITNSTLLELSDLNKPLLRQLAIRAPGTYHHSIMVGNLSESATEAIGGRVLLSRVSSYYHDIGKMEKAEYFVENQRGGRNPHEKLTPNMSCLILINHVKRGLEIAEEYNLPQEIRDFIAQHHGTNIIRFFYEKAKESSDGAEINEADFRYPGPKPQTKETGVVMLADAVEAGSRTLKDPTVSRIRGMVNSLVHERLLDSELDECPLTTKDLNAIKESFVNTLAGMFHGRIKYPDQESKFFGKKNNKKPAAKTVEAQP